MDGLLAALPVILGALGASGGFAVLLRSLGPGRLRADIEQDIAILKGLEGEAAKSMQKCLEWETEALRERVVEGYLPTRLVENVFGATTAIIFGVCVFSLGSSADGVLSSSLHVIGGVVTCVGTLLLGSATSQRLLRGRELSRAQQRRKRLAEMGQPESDPVR